MKKFWLSAVAMVATLLCAFEASAADRKPVAVFTLAGYDALMSDIDYIGEVLSNPQAKAESLEAMLKLFTGGLGLDGVDKTKPWGVAVMTDGNDFRPLVMVPVKNLDDLLAAAKGFVGEPKDEGDGIRSIQVPNGPNPVFKEANGFVFFGEKADDLADLPADPLALMGTLPKEYDIGVRGFMQNVPEQYRKEIVSLLRAGMEQSLEKRDEEDENAFELRKKTVESMMKDIETAVDELESITIGLTIDSTAKVAYLDISATAKPGSKTAKQAAALNGVKSDFAGFITPDVGVAVNTASVLSPEDIQMLSGLLASFGDKVKQEINKDGNLPADKMGQAKEIIDDLISVADKTIQTGKLDGAGTVAMAEKSVNGAFGVAVADGPAVEAIIKKVIEFAKDDLPEVKLNAESHKGVAFHKISIPLPDEKLKDVFGDALPVTVGIGPKSVYLGFGEEGDSMIKSSIDASASAGPTAVAPLAINSSLTPIVAFANSIEPDQIGEMIKKSLSESGGKDHIIFTYKGIPNGTQLRFQVDEGVIRLINVGVNAFTGGGFGGRPPGF